MEINEFKKPAPDEIEVTTISGGLNGESVVLHLGDDKWVIIDSCKGEGIKLPLPLYYLKEIEVDFENVILIICTHWHTDHINGLVEVVKECENAKFVMGKIGNKKDFILRLLDPENESPEDKRGIEETFVGCMEELQKRKTFLKYPEYALCNTSLYDDYLKGCPVKLTALSPSGLLYEDFDRDMIDESKESLSTNKEKKLYDLNLCSIALSLTVGTELIILGADMERNDPLRKKNQFCVKNCEKYERYGWCNALRASNVLSKNKRFGNIKLPHHASITGFCPLIWDECSRVATSTLYSTKNRLPKTNMLRTYKPLVSDYYLASRHELNQPYEEGNLLGDIMDDPSSKPSTSASVGIVCTRLKAFGTEWKVMLNGAACKVDDDVINDYMEIERIIDKSKPEEDTIFQIEKKSQLKICNNH